MPLTKAQLVKKIAIDTGFSQKKSAEILAIFLKIFSTTLAKGENVAIRGFGKFKVVRQKERKVRHPATGKIMIIKARNRVQFKCFKTLKTELNGFVFDIEAFKRENRRILQQLLFLIENSTDYEDDEQEEDAESLSQNLLMQPNPTARS